MPTLPDNDQQNSGVVAQMPPGGQAIQQQSPTPGGQVPQPQVPQPPQPQSQQPQAQQPQAQTGDGSTEAGGIQMGAMPMPGEEQQNPAQGNGAMVGNGLPVEGSESLLAAALTRGLITEQQKPEVESQVTQGGKSIEEALVAAGADEKDVYHTKADMNGIEFVDLSTMEIDPEILKLIPANLARQNMAIPVEKSAQGVKVAMTDPLDLQKTQYMGAATGQRLIPVFSSPTLINYVLDNKYGASVGTEVAEALEDVGEPESGGGTVIGETTDLAAGNLASAPVSKIVNMILEYAIKYKASDVHIEPRESKISVRFRVYGVLQEKLTLPKKLHPSVVSRVKILSNLKIDEHRVPQDGRFQVKMGDAAVDLRVSVVPAVYGEKIVMRLLEKGGGQLSLEDTGMRGYTLKLFKEALNKTQGIILVTGPTGSGKTQTLASSLQILNKPEVNIMTLEDPVEIRVDGVNQVQVNADVGLTFARGLRSFLRQDPDVIMVGEIRDKETAELAVQAALTGHLVLATLHTNSAAGAVPRLIDMGVEPFLLSSTLNIVLAQRLVRRVCEDSKEAYYAQPEVAEEIHKLLDGLKGYNMFDLPNNDLGNPEDPNDDKIVLYRGKPSPNCGDTGYKARLGIFEPLTINESIGKLVMKQASTDDIHREAVSNGMITMAQDGFMKALEGITTIEEVLRVQKN